MSDEPDDYLAQLDRALEHIEATQVDTNLAAQHAPHLLAQPPTAKSGHAPSLSPPGKAPKLPAPSLGSASHKLPSGGPSLGAPSLGAPSPTLPSGSPSLGAPSSKLPSGGPSLGARSPKLPSGSPSLGARSPKLPSGGPSLGSASHKLPSGAPSLTASLLAPPDSPATSPSLAPPSSAASAGAALKPRPTLVGMPAVPAANVGPSPASPEPASAESSPAPLGDSGLDISVLDPATLLTEREASGELTLPVEPAATVTSPLSHNSGLATVPLPASGSSLSLAKSPSSPPQGLRMDASMIESVIPGTNSSVSRPLEAVRSMPATSRRRVKPARQGLFSGWMPANLAIALGIAGWVGLWPAYHLTRGWLGEQSSEPMQELSQAVKDPLAVERGDQRSPEAILREIDQKAEDAQLRYWGHWGAFTAFGALILALPYRRKRAQ